MAANNCLFKRKPVQPHLLFSFGVLTACVTEKLTSSQPTERRDSSDFDTAAREDNGEYVYTTVCLRCHGGNAIDILDLATEMTDLQLEDVIVNGSGIMPPQNELAPEDVSDVVFYIRRQLSSQW